MSYLNEPSAGLAGMCDNIDRQFDLLLQRMLSLVPPQEHIDALREARLHLEQVMEAWNNS